MVLRREPFSALPGRLVVASNRLPIRLVEEDGETVVRPGSGGLVGALEPALQRLRGLWIGWDGGETEGLSRGGLSRSLADLPYDVAPVRLPPELVKLYYDGFANETLWPLFHDLLDRTRFARETFEAYEEANRRFADEILAHTGPGDTVWVHDYHLALVAREVRKRADRRLLWYLHIPFPPVDVFARLPWRWELMDGILQYDLVGFQTRRDLMNFLGCLRTIIPGAVVRGGGGTVRRVQHQGREVQAGWFPISIDFAAFDELARTPEVEAVVAEIRAQLPGGRHVLGVDRLDYTKGIPERLRAFERFLDGYPGQQGRVHLIQVAVPSREDVPEYQEIRRHLEQEVGRINGRFTKHGWTPILYVHRNLDRAELVGHYRACEVALVTPLKDGMNLVAKEYCASSIDHSGVLILSEFAGAAAQLFGPSLIVNPHDVDRTAEAIHRALTMDPEERAIRMQRLRRQIREHDVTRWVLDFSAAAGLVRDAEPPPGVRR